MEPADTTPPPIPPQQPAPTAALDSSLWSAASAPPTAPAGEPELPTFTWIPAQTASGSPAPAAPSAPAVPQRRRRTISLALVALVLASFLAGSVGGGVVGSLLAARSQPASLSAAPAAGAQSQPIAQIAAGDTSAIYQAASPAVVEVATSTQDRWGRPVGAGSGSGFVVDASGLIFTNQHVVAGATSVTVRFSTGAERSATVVGQDSTHDLALLQVDELPAGVPAATLGNSDSVQPGEPAIAIGSPFGLEQTVTQGIVSAVNRTWSGGTSLHHGLIQTDAPINPGNSGGPLLNARGEVIGITTLIESPVEGNVGIGFAVPINTARAQFDLLAGGAQLEQGFMGVALAESADGQAGVTISAVEPGSGAEKAALQAGDVITAIDGAATPDYASVASLISGRQPGQQVAVTFERGGAEQQATVTLQARSTQS